MSAPLYLSAKEAAAELNVSLPTLYAYVSRGMIRSEARGGRSRLYRAEDVRALLDRRDRDEGRAGAALQWGAPVLESALTLITGDGLYYRGMDAVRLAGHASLETVACLLWDSSDDPFQEDPPEIPAGWLAGRNATLDLKALDRCQSLLPLAAAADPRAHALTADGTARTGARVLRWVAAILADRKPSPLPVHLLLAEAWKLEPEDADLIRMALVLCADHELNPSTFTVRCVASTGASPYGSVLAGLAALRGPKHGGITERVGALLNEFLAAGDPAAAVVERLQRGDGLPGFGHPLYPQGDVRARLLLRAVAAHHFDDPLVAQAQALARAGEELSGQAPTIDFALSVLARVLRLPPEAPLSIFAAGRVAGWIGHHREQAAGGELIRPRARYVGRRP
jgi:citrate synthase